MKHVFTRPPWIALTGALALGVAASGVGYAAITLAQSTPASIAVACVNNTTGQVRVVDGVGQCTKREHQLLLQMPTTAPPTSIVVDCTDPGASVNDALAAVADVVAPVSIEIDGTCTENVTVERDGVTLAAGPDGGGITAPPAGGNPISLLGVRNVHLSGLTLTGGNAGLWVWNSAFTADDIVVTDAKIGVQLQAGSYGYLGGATVQNSTGPGVRLARTGGTLVVDGGQIVDNAFRGLDCGGGDVDLDGVEVARNGGGHAVVAQWEGCNIRLDDANVHDNNGDGVIAFGGSSITIYGGTVSNNHGHSGVIAQDGGFVGVYGVTVTGNDNGGATAYSGGKLDFQRSQIDANDGTGVRLFGGSVARLESSTTVNGNHGPGVSLDDTSVATFSESNLEVANNDGWGVTCMPSPAVAMIHVPPSWTGIHDNGGGDLNCPVG